MSDNQPDVLDVAGGLKSHLRAVDLNLLTVFDAVMQLQNITRAAQMLGMSQPAVSNAIARLKVIFEDELFVRFGRGIQPTPRAWRLFESTRQALQLIQNELPAATFQPQTSERVFHLCICSPLVNLLMSIIYNSVKNVAPNIHLQFTTSFNQNIEQQIRQQEAGFVISYDELSGAEFTYVPLFYDEMALIVGNSHPRLNNLNRERDIYKEQHAVVSLDRFASFSAPWYDTPEKRSVAAYEGMAMTSVLNVVSQTNLVAIAPRWLGEEFALSLDLTVLPLPLKLAHRRSYLCWHAAAGRDKGHRWMQEMLISACRR
ncbi:transcriptional regulator LeuO [Tenebrionibacter intestinalis]|uniref:Transcriptional regulator LeuO n=1 Tax=Tenebrionibacter intestinalis TaxID=2799638 RepID=A0A8K0V254_9ENTR|nr:transcriptional regulator LeuO [Tenebrionibacter intestinalis]MBK4713953.1 transcriptional regulator LeuO [Tenebrionibacter intestinalis]